MEQKFVVKDFETQTYFGGKVHGHPHWLKEAYLAEYFLSEKDALNFIDELTGRFQIEVVYVPYQTF